MAERVDRFEMKVSCEKTRDPEISIDIPTYFKIDTKSLYDAVIKELTKQEKKSKKERE